MRLKCLSLLLILIPSALLAAEPFRVTPYLQNPTQDAISILWISPSDQPGTVTLQNQGSSQKFPSLPIRATALVANPFGEEPDGPHPEAPYLHRVRITGLKSGQMYSYSVQQGAASYSDTFRTAPDSNTPIRFLVYSDSETEPESSTSPPVDWPVGPKSQRPKDMTRYVVNQTMGYRENVKVMDHRQPDFITIVGDLVESGGEQRDWDEFWQHNAGKFHTLAGHVPFFAALGNHENFGGPGKFGGYSAAAADFACEKFRTYFEFPENGAKEPFHNERYHRVDYGPITLMTLDSSDGQPHQTANDTNHNLSGSHAADFHPGSEQYAWLERQLAEAQQRSRFTFVQFHHTMYGSGPHSVPFGQSNFSGQSGIAMRVLEPLFHRYGVDAVFSGHDELLERSMTEGQETRPNGTKRLNRIHFYDAGLAGDGLRGSSVGFDNPHRQFLAHDDAPEVWEGQKLVAGGKHYGHLEVNVAPNDKGIWETVITPVHIFPLMNDAGEVTGWERRIYEDVVTIPEKS